MKNITVSVSDDIYRAARVRAAELGQSISAVVAEHLTEFANSDAEFERLREKQRQIVSEIKRFTASDRLNRDAIHERGVR